MLILAIDIGGGTQDILLFDSLKTVENCVKMVMPSPAIALSQKVMSATARKRPILFTGVNMGAGPAKGSLKRHISAGFATYATPEAACTFYDDPDRVREMGITIVSADEAKKLKDVEQIYLKDLYLDEIRFALSQFGVSTNFDAVAVAVLDHGEAPKGVSDRTFRFEHIERVVKQDNTLEAFVYLPQDVPSYLTRMKSVAKTLDMDVPLVLLDTGVAAALGALQDEPIKKQDDLIMINLGNFHTLAFRLHDRKIMGLFEHHTGRMTTEKLDYLLNSFIACQLTNEDVFNDRGHGCLPMSSIDEQMPFVAATGPQRGRLTGSSANPYMAAPYGDMMLTGCYGLIRGVASRIDDWREETMQALED
ncbi:MAG: DUF1786 domain-containing protein [Chloroflexi bacterium]|jgi:uncharacterized protein (DUF1786 family)|nr:DUF1786 domain-containing protein [Chloroflexota bacterium]MBT7080915.1 DUF1786 domain-containing protein [Chloroflexota bacterium]MBT7289064.1 DUF1786 domain-containing protein [Chloroflexota bacterium]